MQTWRALVDSLAELLALQEWQVRLPETRVVQELVVVFVPLVRLVATQPEPQSVPPRRAFVLHARRLALLVLRVLPHV
jgi:hypothetical protein